MTIKERYKITVEFVTYDEYETDPHGQATFWYDHYTERSSYNVRYVKYDKNGNITSDECLENFDTFEEAMAFEEEMKERDKKK